MFSIWFSIFQLCLMCLLASQLAWFQAKPASASAEHTIKASSLDGVWLGALHTDNQLLQVRLNIETDASGVSQYTMYSLDQGRNPFRVRM